MRVEIQMKTSHLPWAKKEKTSKKIDLQRLFNDYWTSKAHELTVQGQSWSPTGIVISDREMQRSLILERATTL